MRRREFIAGLGSAAAWPAVAHAQQGDRVLRIGVLKEGFGDRHLDCLCGFEIDDQLELGRILDGQLTGLCTFDATTEIATRFQTPLFRRVPWPS